MSAPSIEPATPPAAARSGFAAARRWALLVAVVGASGCAALIYQVVWFQLLTLVIGASALSLGVLLATFMGGMCIGALAFPRVVAPSRHPLLVYAAVEAAIAVAGLAVLFALPALATAYSALSPAAGVLARVTLAAICLLPPTILIGATLPALARALPGGARPHTGLGVLYGANIAGAVIGSLLAGFYLLRAHDVTVATSVAAALNLGAAAVCVAAVALARGKPAPRSADETPVAAAPVTPARPVYAAAALSGFTALAAEVLWTRQLSLLLGATVYTFALILAIFLLGLGLGTAAGTALARRRDAWLALAGTQAALCAAVAWAAWAVAQSLPYWPLDVTLPTAPAVALQVDLVRVSYAVLPAAVLWGASFPLALAAARAAAGDASRLVADVYAANTVGAIAGALATSFWLVEAFGSAVTHQILVGVSALAAALLAATSPRRRTAFARPAAIAACAAIAGLCAALVPQLPADLVAFGRFLPTRAAGAQFIYVGEGRTASVAVSEQADGIRTYHNAGKAQASTYPQDMRLQRMLGHLSTLAADQPRDVLVIGLGAGITAGAVSIDPRVERVVVAEIEPLVAHVAREYFAAPNHAVVDNAKVEVVIDDGRHFLTTTQRTFDAITSDPLDPWVKGAAALYTREFWELAKARLNPGGTVTVFLQLYESTENAVRSEVATFFEVFPNGAVFANTVDGMGYDAVLFARAGGTPIDVSEVAARLRSPEYARVARSLREVGFESAADLLGTFAGYAPQMRHWLAGAELNTDRNLRLQYLAGAGLNLYAADTIFAKMRARGGELPAAVFEGSAGELEAVRQRVRARGFAY